METISRKTRGRLKWWTAAAALVGFVVPVAGQPADQLTLPARPVSTAPGAWPDYPQPAGSNFGASDSSSESLPRFDPTKPAGRVTTSPNLPSFAGFGAARPALGQSISPTGALLPASTGYNNASPWERSPRDFGNGWKNFVSQQITGMPAASLAAPRSASAGPRPDWNWNGYEGYNRGRPTPTGPTVDGASAADLAPFMKYSHLWRPAGQSTVTRPNAVAGQNDGLTAAGFNSVNDVNSKWSGYGATNNPTSAKPPEAGQVHFHAAPPESRPPAPLPPLMAPAPLVSNTPAPVNFVPAPAEGANRLHLQVREKISQICSSRCRNLVVEMISPIRLRIAFLVKDQTEADMLTNLLGSIPELAPYKVDFEVQIGQ